VISRRHDDLCLPSAEDTDVTNLYLDHLTRSHDPIKPLRNSETSHDATTSIIETSVTSHDSLTSRDAVTSHDSVMSHDAVTSHDMDNLLASLTLFDATHLGRLGTAVSIETSSMYVAIVIINCII